MLALKECGCVPCWIERLASNPADAHHVVAGGRRVGHAATYALCKWHHVGQPWQGYSTKQMTASIGPSLHHESKAYHDRYGSESDLVELQDAMLEVPGGEYQMVLAYRRRLGWQ